MTHVPNNLIIQKNSHARQLRLHINKKGTPVLTIPFLCPKYYALKWVSKQSDWIATHSFTPQKFHTGQTINLIGNSYILVNDPKQKTNQIKDNTIIIGGEEPFFHRRTKDIIKKEFLKYLKTKIPNNCCILGVKYHDITLRDTSSRWGSCSSKGNLSFCWRVALAPIYVIDYLIAHETSHLKHMNHSPAFWNTVSLLTSEATRAKNWLKQHGHKLQIS